MITISIKNNYEIEVKEDVESETISKPSIIISFPENIKKISDLAEYVVEVKQKLFDMLCNIYQF